MKVGHIQCKNVKPINNIGLYVYINYGGGGITDILDILQEKT
jgi:hypothetical protein